MKRILVLLTVTALMVVMLAMSAASAFAAMPTYTCTSPPVEGQEQITLNFIPQKNLKQTEKAGWTCVRNP